MPNFRSKGRVLQKLPETPRAAKKVQGSITFDQGIQLEKNIKFPLKGYMCTHYVKIL